MEALYFTFGSDPGYPYGRGEYVLAVGGSRKDCIDAYKERHPNRPGSDAINCADYYTEKEWKEHVRDDWFQGVCPSEVILSGTAYGEVPEGFGPLWLAIPEKGQILFVQEGSGDALDEGDMADGMVDYMDYVAYRVGQDGCIEEADGGIEMLPYCMRDRHSCLAEAVPMLLESQYGSTAEKAVIISCRQ